MPRRAQILADLAKTTQAIVKWLEADPAIDSTDLLFIDNHLEMMQIGYRRWKLRRRRSAAAAISGENDFDGD